MFTVEFEVWQFGVVDPEVLGLRLLDVLVNTIRRDSCVLLSESTIRTVRIMSPRSFYFSAVPDELDCTRGRKNLQVVPLPMTLSISTRP